MNEESGGRKDTHSHTDKNSPGLEMVGSVEPHAHTEGNEDKERDDDQEEVDSVNWHTAGLRRLLA